MAGGTYQLKNKIQPGVYINRKSITTQQVNQAESGTVVYCMDNDWGERGKLIDISSLAELQNKLGYPRTAEKMRPIIEMFRGSNRTQGANRVRIYIPNTVESGTNAKASTTASDGTSDVLTIEAACYGARGNKINVKITPDLNTPTTDVNPTDWAVWTIAVYMDGIQVSTKRYGQWSSTSSFTKAKLADLVDNDFVKYIYQEADKDKWVEQSNLVLTGGNQGTLGDASYAEFLTSLENVFFNVLCYDGTSTTVKAAITSFIERQCEDRGYYCQAVLADYQADYEGVNSIVNGLHLSDGYHLDKQKITWWYAGCTAGAKYNESLTHIRHPLATSVDTLYSSDEIDNYLNQGNIVFIEEFNIPMVCMDINTFTSFTADKGSIYQSNRTLRVINNISNYCYYQYDINYIGLIDNNEYGRMILKTDIVGYLNNMQANNGIQNFSPDDVTIEANETDKKAVDMHIAIETVDSIEKIYIDIIAS